MGAFFELGLSDLMMLRDNDNHTPTFYLPTDYLHFQLTTTYLPLETTLRFMTFGFQRCVLRVLFVGSGGGWWVDGETVVCGLDFLHWGRAEALHA